MMRTREQIAQAVLDAHMIRDDWRRSGTQVRALIVEALGEYDAERIRTRPRLSEDVAGEHAAKWVTDSDNITMTPGALAYAIREGIDADRAERPDPVLVEVQVLPDHQDRMVVARRVSKWHIGDSAWAHVIVGAYLNPDNAQRALEEEMK